MTPGSMCRTKNKCISLKMCNSGQSKQKHCKAMNGSTTKEAET